MILIFKTSVKTKTDAISLKPNIDSIVKNGKWSFDLEDCDKIFRVETDLNIYQSLISLFDSKGFLCEELDD
ncbi:MAG TPA: hypothetical protein VMV32_03205 [Ignavibacteriaceae bacterium]|nr:hypothetical protein [Ignavibacteriaceae bacterium]